MRFMSNHRQGRR